MQKQIIIIGVVILGIGLAWPLISKLGLGNLPGDIVIKGKRGSFYFPIVTCLIVSLVLSFFSWLLSKL